MNEKKQEKLIIYIKQNQNKFFRLSYSYLLNEADAKDAIQNAILKAWKNASSLKKEEFLSTWFYRILVNECKDMLRKKKRNQVEDMDELEYLFANDQEEKRILQKEHIQDILKRLDEETRMIILLHYFEDKTLLQISKIINQPLSTIKSKLYRTLQSLKIELTKEEKT